MNEHSYLNQSLTGYEIIKIIKSLPRMRYTERGQEIELFGTGDVYDSIFTALEKKEKEND